jgi:hypothetical protein
MMHAGTPPDVQLSMPIQPQHYQCTPHVNLCMEILHASGDDVRSIYHQQQQHQQQQQHRQNPHPLHGEPCHPPPTSAPRTATATATKEPKPTQPRKRWQSFILKYKTKHDKKNASNNNNNNDDNDNDDDPMKDHAAESSAASNLCATDRVYPLEGTLYQPFLASALTTVVLYAPMTLCNGLCTTIHCSLFRTMYVQPHHQSRSKSIERKILIWSGTIESGASVSIYSPNMAQDNIYGHVELPLLDCESTTLALFHVPAPRRRQPRQRHTFRTTLQPEPWMLKVERDQQRQSISISIDRYRSTASIDFDFYR